MTALAARDLPPTMIRASLLGLERPILFRNCPEAAGKLASVLHGWSLLPEPGALQTDVSIERDGPLYEIRSAWLDGALREDSCVSAICTLIVELVAAYLAAHPWLLCLHCGSVLVDGRLVVFPSAYRAGKSTLVARLAAAGTRAFADDVMPIDPADGTCMALGVSPRLRLPLPASASADFRTFVAAHTGISDGYYQYLDLPPSRLARHGERAPIGAIVTLDRRPRAKARLLPSPRGEALRAMITRNFSRRRGAAEILASLSGLMRGTPAYVLRFSDLEDASAAILEAFSGWPQPQHSPARRARGGGSPPGPQAAERSPAGRRRVRMSTLFSRHPRAGFQRVDGDTFLTGARDDAILTLNPLGVAVWTLLETPQTAARAAEAIVAAFPEIERRRIEGDVLNLLTALNRAGLIRRLRKTRPETQPSARHKS